MLSEFPIAKKISNTSVMHGESRTDDYAWLHQKDNPEVVAYLESENTYTETAMAHTKSLQETLYREMVARIKETDDSISLWEPSFLKSVLRMALVGSPVRKTLLKI